MSIVNATIIKLDRALIVSKGLSQYCGCSACDSTEIQLDLEAWS
jgi:hypothetical protein